MCAGAPNGGLQALSSRASQPRPPIPWEVAAAQLLTPPPCRHLWLGNAACDGPMGAQAAFNDCTHHGAWTQALSCAYNAHHPLQAVVQQDLVGPSLIPPGFGVNWFPPVPQCGPVANEGTPPIPMLLGGVLTPPRLAAAEGFAWFPSSPQWTGGSGGMVFGGGVATPLRPGAADLQAFPGPSKLVVPPHQMPPNVAKCLKVSFNVFKRY